MRVSHEAIYQSLYVQGSPCRRMRRLNAVVTRTPFLLGSR